MQKDERDLLEVLKFELKFLEDGGYGRSPKTPWRPLFIFEDSPTCVNYDAKDNRALCSDCVLIHLVPLDCRLEKVPCRQIPLNESGETLDSLYRCKDQHEIEETVASWLRGAIRHLEEERAAIQRIRRKHRSASGELMQGTPLYENTHPKCANPGCPTAFHWTVGGKFFRFRPDSSATSETDARPDAPKGAHSVRHYWLCERCSHAFTLIYDAQYGVVLKEFWPEIPRATQSHTGTSAAANR